MRKSILAMAMTAAASLIAGAANAQTATQDITISATVPKLCAVNLAATGVTDTATIAITAAANVNTAPVTPSAAPYANVACNAPANLQLTSQGGGLTGPTAVSGFENIINYTGSATWNSVTATVNTATVATAAGAEAGTAQAVGANTGSLSVTITPAANAQPLVMGSYSDTLRVTLTPQ